MFQKNVFTEYRKVRTAVTMLIFAALFALHVFGSYSEIGDELARTAFCGAPYFSEEVCEKDSFMLSLTAEQYEKYIVSATVYRPEMSSEGAEIWYIRAKSDGKTAAAFLCRAYERQPCDPAESASFIACGESIVFVKGSNKTMEKVQCKLKTLFGIMTEYKI